MDDITRVEGVTREARLYALKELARRAGVSAEFFNSWKIDVRDNETTIYIEPGTAKLIRFRNAPPNFWRDLVVANFHTVRASWSHPPLESVRNLVPDFVIPFSPEKQDGKWPLFSVVDRNSMECFLDLPISILLSLSRFEEMLSTERDIHGRFPASKSIAFRDGFLGRPIVDEYGLAFEQALAFLLPGWQPCVRKLRVKLSHDVDVTGLPFNIRSEIRRAIFGREPVAAARNGFRWVVRQRPIYLESIMLIVQLSLERDLDSAVYWQASRPGARDAGYDPRHPSIRQVISWLHDHGVETGVHPGYETFLSPQRLQEEVGILREVLGQKSLGGRQHYLRWCPRTWVDWEACELAYDSTVGYADQIGFRAGTCFPYRPWLLSLNREANLIEIPLIVMDSTLVKYMGLSLLQSLQAVEQCVARCRCVGGVFTLLWHNTALIDPVYNGLYDEMLKTIAGSEKFDWSKEFY